MALEILLYLNIVITIISYKLRMRLLPFGYIVLCTFAMN